MCCRFEYLENGVDLIGFIMIQGVFYIVYQIWIKLRLEYNSLNDLQDFRAKNNLLRAAENTQTNKYDRSPT